MSDHGSHKKVSNGLVALSSAAVRGIPTLTKPVSTPARVTIFVYVSVITAAATLVFRRRDVASTS